MCFSIRALHSTRIKFPRSSACLLKSVFWLVEQLQIEELNEAVDVSASDMRMALTWSTGQNTNLAHNQHRTREQRFLLEGSLVKGNNDSYECILYDVG